VTVPRPHSRGPFLRLVQLFAGRVFHGSNDSAEGEVDVSIGLALALLALPGGFYSMLLFEKYSSLLQWMRGQHVFDPLSGALPDEYFFIVLSMMVTGAVAVWRWDSVFPDRRDYSNLVPLPIPMRNIFLANMAAILLLAMLLAIDVNAVSALLFPIIVSASQNAFGFFVRFVWVHAVVVGLASLFGFFAVIATIGVLLVALPHAAFRKASLYLRGTIMACLVAMLATSFAVPSMLGRLPGTAVRFLPPVWFLGLCQLIRGKASPPLASLGRLALIGTASVVVAAMAIYAVSYRRRFIRIPEAVDSTPAHGGRRFSWIYYVLDLTILRSPFQRAGYRFAIKTLLRSERHGLLLGGFLGFAIVTASQLLFASYNGNPLEKRGLPSSEVLAIPLVLSYCSILAVRFAFDIPSELPANWVFRMCVDKATNECVSLARKLILILALPVLVAVLPVYGYLWGWRVGIPHAVVVAVWSVLLTEILLLRFRKIPFTCTFPPFQDSAVLAALSYVLGFFVFVMLTSTLEHQALSNPVRVTPLIAMVLIAWYVRSRFRQDREEIDKELIFEERGPAPFALLDLRRGS